MEGSEVKRGEEVDAANGRTAGKRTALNAVWSVEVTRAENSCRIRQIYIIKRVASGDTKSQGVTAVGAAASAHLRSRAKHGTAARTTAAAAATATAGRTTLPLALVAGA